MEVKTNENLKELETQNLDRNARESEFSLQIDMVFSLKNYVTIDLKNNFLR